MGLYTKIIDIQKLNKAWQRVKKNKPASGADNVSYEMFDAGLKANIKLLNEELKEGTYECLPVKNVKLFRGEKERTIALYSMRDKVVQQSMAQELSGIYDAKFSDRTFAYRPDKSALIALEQIEDAVKKGCSYALKLDITHFFDEIDKEILKRILEKDIREADVIELILSSACARTVSDDGEIREKERGIHQGSSLAPVLSNIYLKDFDSEMENSCGFYLRYADDMLLLSDDKNELEAVLEVIKLRLQSLNLRLNEGKTVLTDVASGFEFLGYCFDEKGKTVTSKAEEGLFNKLEKLWLEDRGQDTVEKLNKGAMILDGWEQYFRGERQIQSVYEYAVVLYMLQKKKEADPARMIRERHHMENYDEGLAKWLAGYWREREKPEEACFEYEDYLGFANADKGKLPNKEGLGALNEALLRLLEDGSKENLEELMQLYSDLGMYNKAAIIMEKLGEKAAFDNHHKRPVIEASDHADFPADLKSEDIKKFSQLFVGREDIYAVEEMDKNGRRICATVPEPLTESVLKMHFAGINTVATFVQRSNATSKYLVIDVDISKRVFLSYGDSDETVDKYLRKAADLAFEILKELRRMGLSGFIEESGFRGYHIWVLFSEWIPVRYINMLEDIIEEGIDNPDGDVSVEFFPNKARVKKDKFGQSIKLPLGVHIKSGKFSRFLAEDFSVINNPGEYICGMATFSAAAVKKILGKHKPADDIGRMESEVDTDLSEFDIKTESIRVVMENCNLMRYLCQKSRKTGYLTHFERLSLLNVLAHLGDEGKDFLHHVMSFTLNYNYHITQKFISKRPEKPISCIKLREQYKRITAEYGCSCNFRQIKNCYPSPVIHAIKDGEDVGNSVTIPTSRTLSKEKKEKVMEELNIPQKVQKIAASILELKKQKRSIDKNIKKYEKELESIFDDSCTDTMEVSFGMLTRRKIGGGYEWIVEI